MRILLLLVVFFLCSINGYSQSPNPVYVDPQGVMRWTHNRQEAAFFGVNYTVPFAYGYRSHQALGIDLEKAIDRDVYHMARLGLDAFRVHVWDTQISDSLGNLLENEHLRLFDYLVYKLKQRNIKILITPIAFWLPYYPEPDQPTAGFSSKYGKRGAVTEEGAFKAQERYLQQFFRHVNPYTKTTYQDDPDIIAAEVNNEPVHGGPKERAQEYVNRMVKAIRETGWTKPVFYNISESPTYADAVAKANIDGVSFQWYPTGLVANHTLKGNYLPHVDQYRIPFDTIPQYANKARMVYEFDSGDVLQSVMYPAMARSFREAGFQWATQFAYDPMATAYGNTEYQTHYLNLAYTPAKAISFLIAAKAFHRLPRLKSYGTYPADSIFDVFRVSYKEDLSEMNTPQEFYYSNSTRTKPVNAAKLAHVAGVGSSPVVRYQGTGAYFLDKLENGAWRLEVMPDAIQIRDPFAKASPDKEVTRIQWQENPMQINLTDLGVRFTVQGINEGNAFTGAAKEGRFQVRPGTYLLLKRGKKRWSGKSKLATIQLKEFVAPQPVNTTPFVSHQPLSEVSAGKSFKLEAKVVGIEPDYQVSLLINNFSGVWKTIPMQRVAPYQYEAEVPDELTTPGLLSYRIMVQKGENDYLTFPGGHAGYPFAWDYHQTEAWQTFVAAENGGLSLFNATVDRILYVYPNLWKSDERQLITAEKPGQLVLRLTAKERPAEGVMGWQHYVGDKLKGRAGEVASFDKIVIRARTTGPVPVDLRVALITQEAAAFAAAITLTSEFQDLEIPLQKLQAAPFMLLPRPYPGFHPFWFEAGSKGTFKLGQVEKLEISAGHGAKKADWSIPVSFEVESVWLQKKK